MATDRFTVAIDDRARADLRRLLRGIGDLTPLMRAIAGVMEDASQQAFEDQADPETGAPWSPLKPGTVAARGGDATPILQRRGDLARLTSDYGRRRAVVGSNEPYAAIHQFGGTPDMAPGPAGIPARPYLGLSDADRDEIGDLTADYLAKTLAGNRR